MRMITACLLWLFALSTIVTAWTMPELHTLKHAVLLPTVTQPELIALKLDKPIYNAVPGNLESLQLRNTVGDLVPYIIRPVMAQNRESTTKTWTAKNPQLTPQEGKGLEILVGLSDDDPQPTQLSIVSPLKNYEQSVRVFAAQDGAEFEPLVDDAVIFDYSQYMDVRRNTIPLPAGSFRQFRVVIQDITSEQESQLLELTRTLQGGEENQRTERSFIDRRPFRIDRIEFSALVEVQQSAGQAKMKYPDITFHYGHGDTPQYSDVRSQTRHQPLTKLTLQTPAKNFSRHVVVQIDETPGRKPTWRTLASKTLSRIDFKGFQEEDLSVEFPETRADRYRMVIDNQDAPRLEVTGIEAEGNVYEMVFLAGDGQETLQPDPRFTLYGGEHLKPLQYNTSAIQTLLQKGFEPIPSTLGEWVGQIAEPPPTPPASFQWSDLLNNRPVLFTIIGLLVVALGFGLYKAAKRIDAIPTE